MTPMKAIRMKCLDCCCGSTNEVKLCTCVDCTLFPFRFGKRPSTLAKKEAAKNHELSATFSAQK